jgi:hypothetical protein
MPEPTRITAAAILEKLRAKAQLNDEELHALQIHVDELERRRLAARDTHHHDGHGVQEALLHPVERPQRG